MGTFFKALEQAERERALREEKLRRSTSDERTAVAPSPSLEEPTSPTKTPTLRATGQMGESVPASSIFQRPAAVKERQPSQPATREVMVREASSGSPHGKVTEHLVSLLKPTSFEAEQYRALRHRVEELHKNENVTILGISSCAPGDGKTITAINLAGALAQSPEARVLIVDADLRRPSLSARLGLDGSRARGLVGAILDSRLSLKDVVESCPPFNLSVLQAGRQPSSPYEILKSPRLTQLLDEARRDFDYVILDMPPLVPLPDCSVIGRSVDGFLVVVAAHKTPRKVLQEALSVLNPSMPIGIVFNVADRLSATHYHYSSRSSRRRHAGVSEEGQ